MQVRLKQHLLFRGKFYRAGKLELESLPLEVQNDSELVEAIDALREEPEELAPMEPRDSEQAHVVPRDHDSQAVELEEPKKKLLVKRRKFPAGPGKA